MKLIKKAASGRKGECVTCRQAVPAGRGWAASKGVPQAYTDAAPSWEVTEGEPSMGAVRERVISDYMDQYLH